MAKRWSTSESSSHSNNTGDEIASVALGFSLRDCQLQTYTSVTDWQSRKLNK